MGLVERLAPVEKLMVDVGPKFLEDVPDTIVQQLASPSCERFLRAAAFLARVVKTGNFRGYAAAKDFREINPSVSCVTLSDPQAADGVARAVEEPSAIKGVITRVLMQDGRKDRAREIVFDACVGESMPVVAAVASRSLTEFRVSIGRLLNTRLDSDRDEGGIIESALRGQPKLLLGRQRRKVSIGAYSLKVWHYPKNTLGLLAARIVSGWRGAGRCWRRHRGLGIGLGLVR